MKARLLTLLSCAFFATQTNSSAVAAKLAIDWSRSLDGTYYPDPLRLAADATGNLLIAGPFYGSIDIGGGPLTSAGGRDFFVAKLSPTGQVIWSKRFGGSTDDDANGIGVDAAGNIFLAGYFSGTVDFGGGPLNSAGNSDTFVASLDPSGAYRWAVRFGNFNNDGASNLKVDSTGRVLVVGGFRGIIDLGGGPLNDANDTNASNAFVLCLDNSGVYQWSTGHYGYADWFSTSLSFVDVDAADNVYVAGRVSDCEFGVCIQDAFICKYSLEGNKVWEVSEHGYAAPHSNYEKRPEVHDLAVNALGEIFVIGLDLGCSDPYQGCGASMECYSTNGTVFWRKLFANTTPFDVGVDTDSDDNPVIVGAFSGSADFGSGPITSYGEYDMFVAKYLRSSGAHVWDHRIGGVNNEFCTDVVSLGIDQFAFSGDFRFELDVDGTTHTSTGWSALIAKGGISNETPVAITVFDAAESDGSVQLSARFQSDLDVTGVNVYRSMTAGEFRPVLIASVQDIRRNDFAYVDRDVSPGESYRYQIGVTAPDGEFLSGIVTVSMAPGQVRLFPNRPNPFNPETTIRFSLPARERVTIIVYDAAGRLIRTLLDDVRPEGTHEIAWDGTDDRGMGVSSGVYFCRLEAGKNFEALKLVLLK